MRSDPKATDDGLLTRLHVDQELKKRIRTLSGGTRQRLSAAIAFMFRPDVLILDEPTAGLDPVSSRILKDEIIRYKSDGKTVIISSHILSDLEEISDNIVFLCEGMAMFAGTRQCLLEVTSESQLDRSFIALMKESHQ
jgi:Cu-processing system ATP-binding protein